MRKLHLVGVTTDLKGLIFTARKGSKSGGYMVALDPKLMEAVDGAARRRNGDFPTEARMAQVETTSGAGAPAGGSPEGRHQSALSPREMQARLRAGRSIEEVAVEAGVGAEWVARFAVPILAEQVQVVALARGLTFAKPRLGESSMALGPSVSRNLAERGLTLPDDLFDLGWAAHQLHDSLWMVRFRHDSRGRVYEAHWELEVATGRLVARNRLASDLGYVDPGGRRRVDPRAGEHRGSAGEDGQDHGDTSPDNEPPIPSARAGSRSPATIRAGASGARASAAAAARSRASSRPKDGGSGSGSTRTASKAKPKASGGDAKPTVRGGGIRAATAQVASAQVAASRSLVARTVLPAPRPSASRRGGFEAGTAGTQVGREGGSESGSRRPPVGNSGTGPVERGASRGSAGGGGPTSRADSLIDDLLVDSRPSRLSHSARPDSPPERSAAPIDVDDHLDDDTDVPAFRPRPRPTASSEPAEVITRVRSGGPVGLVRTSSASNPKSTGGNSKRSDSGADRREPVRVPSTLSPASGADRGMPLPRTRSRLLRRTR